MVFSAVYVPVLAADTTTVTKIYGQNFDLMTSLTAAGTAWTYSGDEVRVTNNASNRVKLGNTGSGDESELYGAKYLQLQKNTTTSCFFPFSTAYDVTDTSFANVGAATDLYIDFDFHCVTTTSEITETVYLCDSDVINTTNSVDRLSLKYASLGFAIKSTGTAGTLQEIKDYTLKDDGTVSAIEYADLNGSSFQVDKWNNIRFVVHLTDNEKAVQTFDLYLNGALVKSNIAFIADKDSFMSRNNIRTLVFTRKQGETKEDTKHIKLDNVYVYSSNGDAVADYYSYRERIWSLPSKLTMAKNAGTITEDQYTSYTTQVESCKTLYLGAVGNGYTEADFARLSTMIASIEKATESVSYPTGGLKYSKGYESDSSDFFDGTYGIGKFGSTYTTAAKAATVNLVTENEVTSGNGVQIPGEATTINGIEYSAANEGPDAKLIFEFDLMTHDLRKTGSDLTIKCNASDNTDSNGLFNVKIKGSDGLVYKRYARISGTKNYDYQTSSTTYTKPLNDDEWHRVRIEIKATNSDSAVSANQSMYIDGEPVFTDAKTSTDSTLKFGEINTLTLTKEVNSGSYAYGPRIYYDNISVYKANENAAETASCGALVKAIRDAELLWVKGIYSDETVNGISAQLASAKSVLESGAAQSGIDAAASTLRTYLSGLEADNPKYIEVKGFGYADADGNSQSEAVNGGTLTGVYVKKNSDGEATLILGIYKGAVLEKAITLEVPSAQENGKTEFIPLDEAYSLGENADIYSFKAFAWTGNALKPLDRPMTEKVKTDKTGVKIMLIGDSTVADYDDTSYPQKGWGQMLPNYFDAEKVTIDNRAVPGTSTKSFRAQYWTDAAAAISEGDYVFIQFGHNDQKASESLYANYNSTYKDNLRGYIDEIKAKGATPILVTPTARALAQDGGIFVGMEGHGAYPDAVREVAEENNVLLIDLMELQSAWIAEQGYANVEKDMWLFVDAGDTRYIGDSEFAGSVYNKDSATKDRTHFAVYGADVLAKLVCDELARINHPLKNYQVSHTPQKKTVNQN